MQCDIIGLQLIVAKIQGYVGCIFSLQKLTFKQLKQGESFMKLNDKITKLRKQKGLSQEALAEKLSVSRQAISKWETGESLPDMDNIAFLCKEFDVSADFLLNEDIENPNEFCVLQENSQATAKKLTATRIALICVCAVLALILIFIPTYILAIEPRNEAIDFFRNGNYISNLKIISYGENVTYEYYTDAGYNSYTTQEITFFNAEITFKQKHDDCAVVFIASYGNSDYDLIFDASFNGVSYCAKIHTENYKKIIDTLTLQVTVGDQVFTTVLLDINSIYGYTLKYDEIWNNAQ